MEGCKVKGLDGTTNMSSRPASGGIVYSLYPLVLLPTITFCEITPLYKKRKAPPTLIVSCSFFVNQRTDLKKIRNKKSGQEGHGLQWV